MQTAYADFCQKQTITQSNKQITQSKMSGRPKQTFIQNKTYRGPTGACSTSLIIRLKQIKTTKKYHFTLVKMTVIKKFTNSKCWKGCGEKGTLLYC